MSSGLIPEKCPECGGPLKFLEKNSFNGHVFREYWCAKCEDMITLDGGEALWQVLHEANETNRDTPPPATTTANKPKRSWWKFWK
jgi:hypothetical protein